MSRLPITKTPKAYVGGAFIRSESGRVFALNDQSGAFFANIPQCTRKDLRNAVEAAAKAGAGWARRTPYNRGQILYRLGEMLESRAAEMTDAITRTSATSAKNAAAEVAAAIDRLIYFSGWADKYEQVLGNSNAVAAPYFNFTITEPVGIVGIIAPDAPSLLPLISQIAPIITSGNAVVALASTAAPYPAILLGEMLATSDLPGGVVNIVTGFRKEMLETFATHTHFRGLDASVSPEEALILERGAAASVKRVHLHPLETDWLSPEASGVYDIRAFLEFKTVWHPIGA